jgi:hypothetical protein
LIYPEHAPHRVQSIRVQQTIPPVAGRIFATSTRPQLAQKPDEKLASRIELPRIVQKIPTATGCHRVQKNPDLGQNAASEFDREIVLNRVR